MTALMTALRDGAFLTRARVAAWSSLALAGFLLAVLYLLLTAHGLNDHEGRPLGTDFSDIYAAGLAALRGHAADPFDIYRQAQMERTLFGAATPLYGWHYPPFFLLVAAPLARLPYLDALLAWQAGTLALYLAALWALLRGSAAPQLARDRLWPLVALGFSAVFVNLTHGHNGFLTAALFAGGLALLDKRPFCAGLLFGALAYKPQFALLIPLLLTVTGRWRSFAAAAATVAALALLVTLLFGAAIWPAFLASTHFTRVVVLEQGSTGFYKIQSLFAAVRLWGGPVWLAYIAQALLFAAVTAALVRIWRGPWSPEHKGAALCLGTLLATPYCLDYDLMLLAPAIALLAAEAKARGWRPFDAALLALLWIMPVAARSVAQMTMFPLALVLLLAAFLRIWQREQS